MSCGNPSTKTKKLHAPSPNDQPDQVSWNIKVLFIDSSHTKAILKAKKARIYFSKQMTMLDSGLVMDYFSRSSGKKISTLNADSAVTNDRTKDMTARGHVVVIADSTHTKLETSLLHWDNKTQKFSSTEFVKITSPFEIIQGYGFESDQNLSNYKIYKVSGEHR